MRPYILSRRFKKENTVYFTLNESLFTNSDEVTWDDEFSEEVKVKNEQKSKDSQS